MPRHQRCAAPRCSEQQAPRKREWRADGAWRCHPCRARLWLSKCCCRDTDNYGRGPRTALSDPGMRDRFWLWQRRAPGGAALRFSHGEVECGTPANVPTRPCEIVREGPLPRESTRNDLALSPWPGDANRSRCTRDPSHEPLPPRCLPFREPGKPRAAARRRLASTTPRHQRCARTNHSRHWRCHPARAAGGPGGALAKFGVVEQSEGTPTPGNARGSFSAAGSGGACRS